MAEYEVARRLNAATNEWETVVVDETGGGGGSLPAGWTADSPVSGDLDTGGGALIASSDNQVLKALPGTGSDPGVKLSITAGNAVDGSAGDVDMNAGSSDTGNGGGIFLGAGGGGGNSLASAIDILGTTDGGRSGEIAIQTAASAVSGAGSGDASLRSGNATDTQPGGVVIGGGNALADQDGGSGGSVEILAGSAAGSGYDGGDVFINAGAGSGGGNAGIVKLAPEAGRVGFFGSNGTLRQTLARPSGDAGDLWDILNAYGLVAAP